MVKLRIKLCFLMMHLTCPWIPTERLNKEYEYEVVDSCPTLYKDLGIGKSTKKLFMGLS